MRTKKAMLATLIGVLTALFWLPVISGSAAACDQLAGDKGLASLTVTTVEPGIYTLWLRMWAPDATQHDSVAVQIDDQCAVVAGDKQQDTSFQWVNYRAGDTTQPLRFDLAAGEHVLKIAGREAGAGVDKILLIRDAACTPVNYGENCLEDSAPIDEKAAPAQEGARRTDKSNWWVIGICATAGLAAAALLVWKYIALAGMLGPVMAGRTAPARSAPSCYL